MNSKNSNLEVIDITQYCKERADHWDNVARKSWKGLGGFYHEQLKHYYRLLVSPGQRVLELGCSSGDLLAALDPSVGVGVDFSGKMIGSATMKHPGLRFICADVHDLSLKGTFDVIILSDLINDLMDLQYVIKHLHDLMHPGSRIIMNFYNNIWRFPLKIASRMKLSTPNMEQNWFAKEDVTNLLELSGFNEIRHHQRILFPLRIPFLSTLANRYLVNFWPFYHFAMTHFVVARSVMLPRRIGREKKPIVSVIVPARNEEGNIENVFKRTPEMGEGTELVFVEGGSKDDTYGAIERAMVKFPKRNCTLLKQKGTGKGDAVRMGFDNAVGEILMILDADLTVPPEYLPRFYEALVSERGEFINGVRLVYPMENESMRFFNMLGNKFFSLAFSWVLGEPIKDTLCGTKVLWKHDYEEIVRNRSYFGDFDPFGDFDLIFGATKLNLKVVDLPIRYKNRTYGTTNINRWQHGWLLVKMLVFAARRLKFV